MSSYWDDTDEEPEGAIPVANRLVLGGHLLPGMVELPEGEPGRKLDLKNGPGLDGATATWQGYEPPELKVTLRMWRARHRTEWSRIYREIQPRPGKPPAAPFSIIHPTLADYGIALVMVEKISLPKQGKSPGEVEVMLSLREWVKPSKVGTSTPKQAAVGAPATVHELKGGHVPAVVGPPAPPVDPSQFNAQP